MKSGCLTAAALFLLWLSPCFGDPLHEAARRGDLATLTKLLDQGVALEVRDGTGETPLLVAALAGHAELVAVLIERGAEIRVRNDRGLTPLHAAAYTGSLEAVRLLVQAGANVNDAENIFKGTPLIIAAEEDHVDVEKFLIDRGADIEWTERGGYTALTRAVFRKHHESVDTLLRAGAKCQDRDTIGFWAAECTERMTALPHQ